MRSVALLRFSCGHEGENERLAQYGVVAKKFTPVP